jgi:hypothetical protein
VLCTGLVDAVLTPSRLGNQSSTQQLLRHSTRWFEVSPDMSAPSRLSVATCQVTLAQPPHTLWQEQAHCLGTEAYMSLHCSSVSTFLAVPAAPLLGLLLCAKGRLLLHPHLPATVTKWTVRCIRKLLYDSVRWLVQRPFHRVAGDGWFQGGTCPVPLTSQSPMWHGMLHFLSADAV